MGSGSGDVDDGFALAALLRSALPVAAVASVFGNTSERSAFRNNAELADLCGFRGSLLHGATRRGDRSEASQHLATDTNIDRVVALGPLTNVAMAVTSGGGAGWKEVIVVGMNISSRGRFPPLWPHEFNMTLDRASTRAVFESRMPITLFPLDRLSPLRITRHDLEAIEGRLGEFIRRRSNRWFWRCSLLKVSSSFRVCDLVASMYLIAPELYQFEETRLQIDRRSMVVPSADGTPMRVLRSFDAAAIWKRFVEVVNG